MGVGWSRTSRHMLSRRVSRRLRVPRCGWASHLQRLLSAHRIGRPHRHLERAFTRLAIGVFVIALTATHSRAGSVLAANEMNSEHPERLKACVVSFNEPDELEAFRAHLDRTQFDFVDIRAVAVATQPAAQNTFASSDPSWLLNACTPETTCDLMVYSAEFAGRFFGKQGVSLSLQAMEEASCQARCAGLFQRPREVFLLACNTLATKDEDSRSPEEYLRVLLDHGFDRSSAERVVELRYGPLGPSFRESLRRVFAGVPRIYGFSSVAPRGAYTAPMLARYLRGEPDYARTLLRKTKDNSRNAALFDSFKGTSLAQTYGLTAAEAAAVDREHICALYDETRSVAERLRIAYGFLSRPDALTFVPTVEVFLSRHSPSGFSELERPIFVAIQSLDAARDAVLDLVHQLNVSALKLELAHFALLVGWLEQSEFHRLAVDGATQLLRQRLSAELVDIMCEITKHESLRGDFNADNIPAPVYNDADGLRLLSCLAPADPRVTTRVVRQLKSSDPASRQWAAHTVTQLIPRDEDTLTELVPYVRDPSPEVAERIRWLFQAQERLPAGVERVLREVDPVLLRERAAVPAVKSGRAS